MSAGAGGCGTVAVGKLAALAGEAGPHSSIGMNEPHSIGDLTDFTVPHQGERRGIAHSLAEVRNDRLGSGEGRGRWAGPMCRAVGRFPGTDGA